jgi:CubicO group peptidase (beta-lactamase class C family)
MRYTLLLTIFFLFTSFNHETKQKEESRIAIGKQGERLDSLLVPYINELRQLSDNDAGLAIGVTKGNQTIFASCFGYSNIARQQKVDVNTVFHIASVSKPFVAFAIAKLIEQKKVKLDDKIVDLLPEFEMKGAGYDLITIKHILTHTSGIPANISPDDWTNPSFGEHALEENLEVVKSHTLDFEPGTEFSYSNSAIDILGLVISRVSEMQFSDFVSSEIFVPLGMSNTTYKKEEVMSENLAQAYSYSLETQVWKPYPYNEKLFPSSGVLTSLNDMLRWTKLHLSKGTFEGNRIIAEKYFNLLIEPHFDTPWNEKIGLSWFLQSYLGKPIIMHQGLDTGFESIVYLFPKDKISIVVMANRDFSRTGRIINAIAEILFEEEPKAYEVSAKYQFSKDYIVGGIDKAIATWSRLIKDTTDIYFTDDDDILTTGAILENGAKWQKTKDILQYYNTLNEQSSYAWRLLGNANLNLGDTLTALSNYEKCLEINPGYEKAKTAIEDIKTKANRVDGSAP